MEKTVHAVEVYSLVYYKWVVECYSTEKGAHAEVAYLISQGRKARVCSFTVSPMRAYQLGV